eukprot:jgi/Ulvmu1/5282/UM022_0076.1
MNVDKTVSLLSKRDGIDKVLKVLRYTSKLLLAQGITGALGEKLLRIDSSLGSSRKAIRLGKFLSNYCAVTRLKRKPTNILPIIAGTGEGIYYFLDQFVWLTKIKVLPKTWERHIVFVSNLAELAGYAASITMNVSLLMKTVHEIHVLEHDIIRTSVSSSLGSITGSQMPSGDDDMVVRSHRQLQACRARLTLLLVLLAKDLADGLIATQEVLEYQGARRKVVPPAAAAMCGLLSAAASLWKAWPR